MRGKMLFYKHLRAISSGGERFLHTEEVAGSKPASPTKAYAQAAYIFVENIGKTLVEVARNLGVTIPAIFNY